METLEEKVERLEKEVADLKVTISLSDDKDIKTVVEFFNKLPNGARLR